MLLRRCITNSIAQRRTFIRLFSRHDNNIIPRTEETSPRHCGPKSGHHHVVSNIHPWRTRARTFVGGVTAASLAVLLFSGLDVFAGPPAISSSQEFQTYWQMTQQDRHIEPPVERPCLLSGTKEARVVIIGAGMAGLHTALSLVEEQEQPQREVGGEEIRLGRNRLKGEDVVVLEASQVGMGASGMSKGLIVDGLQVPQEDLSCNTAVATQIYDMTEEAQKLLESRIRKYHIKCEFEPQVGLIEGSIHPIDEEVVAQEHKKSAKGQQGEGENDRDRDQVLNQQEVLSEHQVKERLGSASGLYKGGYLYGKCGAVNPLGLTRGLARACESQGVLIYESTAATKLEKIQDPLIDNSTGKTGHRKYCYRVETSTGAIIECDHVVLCTGAQSCFSPKLSRRLQNTMIPLYTWMVATEPLGERCPIPLSSPCSGSVSGSSGSRSVMGGDDFVTLNYWRRTDDGRLLFGSLADAFPLPAWIAQRRIRRALTQVYPDLHDVRFDCLWRGALVFARHAVPLIGRDTDQDHPPAPAPSQPVSQSMAMKSGVWYATGFGGHGIVPTCMAGCVLADAILGRDDNTWRLFQREFPPAYCFWPFGRLGAQAVLLLYNMFDWLHVHSRIPGLPPRLPPPW